ncbi:auxiliary transport protein, membrane fusion protein (MFP) family protein [Hallella bergensis DSM 17361]|uniref:Auxiliary transport protein, membrane fusion protein (MFP) family protein n=1 Tax=Hallella bergensis DSM 17361 TaxID=585502 RepID=D1PVT7_9BACT|nr:biotin/lipoyl-binding protein [Hallella bergensis]EFA44442.1 auxiliary transport protein, membrane fusion protein (MFP) family protein [Hallella bergensis DSM 17361]
MSAKTQHNNILLAVLGFVIVVTIVGLIGFLTLDKTDEIIQGEVEVAEYRVSSKLPARILELRVKEGDYVHVGDTLAILEMPELDAQKKVAEATKGASEALSDLAEAGARKEQIQGAYQLMQQAKAAAEIAKKSYTRVQNLYDEGVMTAQKRDEAYAAYKAAEAQVAAARSQYEMAKNGAREQEKTAAKKNAQAAKGAVDMVNSVLRETVQTATIAGEVSSIYPKIGELVGSGSPIMSISILNDTWGTFNIREDQLNGMKIGDTFTAYSPAFNKEVNMKVYYIKDQGAYAVWKATKSNGQYDLKTFEVKARFNDKFEGLRPGMSLIIKK